jgi:hypothetical protein
MYDYILVNYFEYVNPESYPAAIPRNRDGYQEGKRRKARKEGDGSGFREYKRISRVIGAFSRMKKPCGGKTSPWSRGGGGLSRSRRPK